MPTFRQSLIARITRLYPFYSGCGTIANHSFLHKLAGNCGDSVWSPVPGGEVLASLSDYDGRAAFFVGMLDRKINWICEKIVKPGDTVLDIGTNIGMVMIKLSSLVGDNGKVHAFEPSPLLQNTLRQTLDRNQLKNVILHPIGLGDKSGEMELRIPRGHAGKASLIRNENSDECDICPVTISTLSDFFKKEKIQKVRLIKIDVEGFEAEVLKGGIEALEQVRPDAIIFEMNEKRNVPCDEQPVFQLLKSMGYRFFSVPKCLIRMHLDQFDPTRANRVVSNDFLAVPEEKYIETAELVNA